MYRYYFLEIIAATYARLKHIRSRYGRPSKTKMMTPTLWHHHFCSFRNLKQYHCPLAHLPTPLKRKQQRQHKGHHDADDELQGQSHTHIIHKGVVSGFHHQGIGRRRERRSETHAGT